MSRTILIASAILLAPSAMAQEQDHSAHEGHATTTTQQPPAQDHSGHEGHTQQPETARPSDHEGHGEQAADTGHGGADHVMGSALGDYPMSRDASGTAWRPAAAPHNMVHGMAGDWMLMGHGNIDFVYTSQSGPRGDDLGFVAGMLMGTAQRRFADDSVLQFRGAISPDPLMGDRGYPLLLAAGETADGVETLVDRQHPHDFFMELSASYSRQLGQGQSVFVYGGLPGEPAFGPPAFMHRPAAEPNPEAPITHHWLDSTHITFGVLTAGYVNNDFKIEASRFRGREPDQDRYDIETGELDSTAVRLSWNPTENLALQTSWADITSPEQLEPDVDVVKWSASALYSRTFGDSTLSLTGAFARKDNSEGVVLDAWLGEAALQLNADWTVFSRIEAVETDELGLDHHGPIENVARATLGVSRDFRLSDGVTMAIGASATQNWTSGALSALYDGDPTGALAFVRFKIQ
jgi:hypothetical protein